MGTASACKCSKEADKNEVDLSKDRYEDINCNNYTLKDNYNSNNYSTNAKNVNTIYNDALQFNSKEDNINCVAENVKAGFMSTKMETNLINYNSEILTEKNAIQTPGHRNSLSNEIDMEILEEEFSNDLQFFSNVISNHLSKLPSNLGSVTNGVYKAPLEIINEIDADVCKESAEGKTFRRNSDVEPKEETFKEKGDETVNTFDYISDNSKIIKKEIGNYKSNNPNSCFVSSDFGQQFLHNNKNTDSENIVTTCSKDKNTFRSRNIHIGLNITSFISEHILLNCEKDEVLFQSELKKLINNEITAHSSQLYSSRFCVITKAEFRYYKSPEQYLTLQKPLAVIPLNLVQEANLVKYNFSSSSKKFNHLVIKLKDISKLDTKPSNYRRSRLHTMESNNLHESLIPKLRKKSIMENKVTTSRKSKVEEEFDITNDEIMIFTSEKEDLLVKWTTVLNYFINK